MKKRFLAAVMAAVVTLGALTGAAAQKVRVQVHHLQDREQ